MGSPSHAVVMKRGPSLLQGMTTPTWQASVKGAQARLPADVQEGLAMLAHESPQTDGLLQEFRSLKVPMTQLLMASIRGGSSCSPQANSSLIFYMRRPGRSLMSREMPLLSKT
jgi:hypothetical protein